MITLSPWTDRLQAMAARHYKNYKPVLIDLSTAHDLTALDMSGDFAMVYKSSSKSALAQIRLNDTHVDALDFRAGTTVQTVFTKAYLSNDAQPGQWLILLVGIDFDMTILESKGTAQPVEFLTCVQVGDDYAGIDNAIDRVLIRALPNNVGTAWINFKTTAFVNQCLPLKAGDSLAVNLANYRQLHVTFDTVGDTIAVVMEN